MNYNEWAFHDLEPVYLQLIQKIEYSILSKQLPAGEELPSIRIMAKSLKISPNTVMKAYMRQSIYASKKKQLNYFFQKWTLFCD